MDVHKLFDEVTVVFSTKQLTNIEIDHLWRLAKAVLNNEDIDDDELEPTVLWQRDPIIEFEFDYTFVFPEKEISRV